MGTRHLESNDEGRGEEAEAQRARVGESWGDQFMSKETILRGLVTS